MLMQAVDELATKLFRAEAELQRALETEVTHHPALFNTAHRTHALTRPLSFSVIHPTHPFQTGDLMPALNNALAMGLSPDISPVVRQAQSPQVIIYIHAYFCCCLYQVFLKWFDIAKNVTGRRKQIVRSRPLNHRLVGHPHQLQPCLNHRSQQL